MSKLQAPHQYIEIRDEKERFLIALFDTLWERYRSRMKYVRDYEAMIESYGAKFCNDHIAFRTIAWQEPATGIAPLARIFESLGYSPAACYEFPDKHLSSIHYQHANSQFPKLFITQLKSWELSRASQGLIRKNLKTHRPALSDQFLARLWDLPNASANEQAGLLKSLVRHFRELPWDLPQKKDVLRLNEESQYGAWVLINGYDVNHFTAAVNVRDESALDDIEKVVNAMKAAGIPMKPEIEGERGSKLRQTSTESVLINVTVKDGTKKVKISWTYAYFEIAERPILKNPVTGAAERFEGFLGGQAANLFEMTKLKK